MKCYREIWLEDIRYPFSRSDLYTETPGTKWKICLTDNRWYIYERGFDSHHLSHQQDGLFMLYFSVSSVLVGPSVLISFSTESQIFQSHPVLKLSPHQMSTLHVLRQLSITSSVTLKARETPQIWTH